MNEGRATPTSQGGEHHLVDAISPLNLEQHADWRSNWVVWGQTLRSEATSLEHHDAFTGHFLESKAVEGMLESVFLRSLSPDDQSNLLFVLKHCIDHESSGARTGLDLVDQVSGRLVKLGEISMLSMDAAQRELEDIHTRFPGLLPSLSAKLMEMQQGVAKCVASAVCATKLHPGRRRRHFHGANHAAAPATTSSAAAATAAAVTVAGMGASIGMGADRNVAPTVTTAGSSMGARNVSNASLFSDTVCDDAEAAEWIFSPVKLECSDPYQESAFDALNFGCPSTPATAAPATDGMMLPAGSVCTQDSQTSAGLFPAVGSLEEVCGGSTWLPGTEAASPVPLTSLGSFATTTCIPSTVTPCSTKSPLYRRIFPDAIPAVPIDHFYAHDTHARHAARTSFNKLRDVMRDVEWLSKEKAYDEDVRAHIEDEMEQLKVLQQQFVSQVDTVAHMLDSFEEERCSLERQVDATIASLEARMKEELEIREKHQRELKRVEESAHKLRVKISKSDVRIGKFQKDKEAQKAILASKQAELDGKSAAVATVAEVLKKHQSTYHLSELFLAALMKKSCELTTQHLRRMEEDMEHRSLVAMESSCDEALKRLSLVIAMLNTSRNTILDHISRSEVSVPDTLSGKDPPNGGNAARGGQPQALSLLRNVHSILPLRCRALQAIVSRIRHLHGELDRADCDKSATQRLLDGCEAPVSAVTSLLKTLAAECPSSNGALLGSAAALNGSMASSDGVQQRKKSNVPLFARPKSKCLGGSSANSEKPHTALGDAAKGPSVGGSQEVLPPAIRAILDELTKFSPPEAH